MTTGGACNTYQHHEHEPGTGSRAHHRKDNPMTKDMSDTALARQIAETAGQILVALQRSGLFADKELGIAGDRMSNAFITETLKSLRPNDAILSEEEAADPSRLPASRVWIVDPLDGSREYGEVREDWAVHIALAVDGKPAIGAVALPGVPLTLCTDAVSQVTVPLAPERPRMLISRTRPAAEAVAMAEALDAALVPMGSAGAKTMAIIRGEADIYLHSGGQYEWDSCAPAAVALAAGLHVSRIDGSPLTYNSPNPWLPDLLICRKEHAAYLLELLIHIQSTGK
jgi:3'(2'), 5'-bisphosphate nucleotidase